MLRRFAIGLALAGSLAACALRPPPAEVAAVERIAAAGFELEGRVAVRDGEHSTAATIYWMHDDGDDAIDFLAPTGQIMGRLESDQGGARLQLPGNRLREAASLDALAGDLLGFDVPVSRLRDWVQAVAGDEARVLRRDPQGRPALISEQGWLIEYTAYANDSAEAPIQRLQARWGELQLTLLVDHWLAR
ncbi:MAG: outer membrane lipoprotein LolB [Zoogloeaceae bacterium]|nr:outer membrane lipoprotein LolB [Rhodocyclaceae bacterium]MCP5234710.1 outer membrane lipoprotein LolB [Zoogloeaceae bacterium]